MSEPRKEWSLPGLIADFYPTRETQHAFLFLTRAFDGRTPAELIDAGEDLIVLEFLRSISFSKTRSLLASDRRRVGRTADMPAELKALLLKALDQPYES